MAIFYAKINDLLPVKIYTEKDKKMAISVTMGSNVNNEILPVKIRTNINCRRFHNNVTKSLMTSEIYLS